MHQRQIVALLSLVCALLYCNTLFSEFVFDDTFAIVRFRISACNAPDPSCMAMRPKTGRMLMID